MAGAPQLLPVGLRKEGDDHLIIQWNDGHESRYQVHFLRRACRCALCVDEWSGKPLADPEAIPKETK